MKPPWPRLLLIAGALLLVLYLGDYISIAYRIPNGRKQFGSVEVDKLLAIERSKDGIHPRSAASAPVCSFVISAAWAGAVLV